MIAQEVEAFMELHSLLVPFKKITLFLKRMQFHKQVNLVVLPYE